LPSPHPLKKRKISHEADDDDVEVIAAAANILKKPHAPKKFQPPPPRKPLEPVQNPSSSLPSNYQAETGVEGYYTVLW
jgi:DNA repair and recombination protein RAD54B